MLRAFLREVYPYGWSMRDLGWGRGTDHNSLNDLMIANRPVAQVLDRDAAADVVVVGCGPNGLAAEVSMAPADLDEHLGWRSGLKAAQ